MTSPTAFFLTAHFSEEDYPYDWYVAVLPSTIVPPDRFQVDALAVEGKQVDADIPFR